MNREESSRLLEAEFQHERPTTPSGRFRKPLLIANILGSLYLLCIWKVNVTHHWGVAILFNIFCYSMLFAMVALFLHWMRRISGENKPKNKASLAIFFLILIVILGSMSVRKGTHIYLASDCLAGQGDPGNNNGEFYYSLLKTLGVWKTRTWENGGTSHGYFYKGVGFLLEGSFELLYPNRNKKDEGYFHNNLLSGKYRHWYENGQIHLEVEFFEGRPNGHVCVWNEDGTKHAEGDFMNSVPSGDWLYYDVGNSGGVKGTFDLTRIFPSGGKTEEYYNQLKSFFRMKN